MIGMKKIKLQTFSIIYCIMGFLFPILGILSENNMGYLGLTASSFIFATTMIYVYLNRKEHISDLVLMPDKVVLIYKKFNKTCKEISMNISDITSIEINITNHISKSSISNTFPFKIDVIFHGNSLYKNFYITRGNYNIVFKIYNTFKNIVNNINIKASGVQSDVMQADIDNYIRLGRRLPLFSRFIQTQSKQNIIEISVAIIIFLIFLIFILFSFANYVIKLN